MPSVLIVDDEPIFRKGLRHMITEMEGDWRVIDEAEDGSEALDKMERQLPDVLITDIMMPVMNGIELQYVLRERYPSVQCIVMSGYSDFEYARESLRMGAKDYLTKPIVRKELYRVLGGLQAELQSRQEQDTTRQLEDKQAKDRLRHHIIKGLLEGGVSPEELDLIPYVGMQFPHDAFCCLLTNLDREFIEDERYYRASPALYSLFITQFIQEAVEEDWVGHVFPLSDTKVVALLNYASGPDGYERVTSWGKKLCKEMKKISNLSITVSLGGEVLDLEAISTSYDQAETALLYRLVTGGDRILTYAALKANPDVRVNPTTLDWSLLDKSIEDGDTEETRLKTRRLVRKLCGAMTSPEMVQQQVCTMLLHYYEMAGRLNLVKTWLPHTDIKHVLEEVLATTTMFEMVETCESLLGRLSELVAARKSAVDVNPIDQVVQYVDQHYGSSITLGMMADKVYLNPSYLSTLFKQKMGITFVDYVTQRRIEEAKRLLLTTERKIADIAKMTGFVNLRHFNRVFRAVTESTPRAYREQGE
ncbi:response regulator transcription factor [Paenibacillus whitsoniae]|uniref:Response regulator n=1 Tax=Paenibacillus whitsoniae TaxID=2496558 RepID=A0A430J5L8_9BACL|nr:response regulator [Paenibacillus whitsoniae]RTE03065.1 response regulator [Paenibacillus whitsoniae]